MQPNHFDLIVWDAVVAERQARIKSDRFVAFSHATAPSLYLSRVTAHSMQDFVDVTDREEWEGGWLVVTNGSGAFTAHRGRAARC